MDKRILVVDDEPSITKLVSYNLEKSGFIVDTAADGQAALDLVVKRKPDLIVLDIMLPRVDGLEVCKQLRQKDIHIPILMLTAKDDEVDRILGLELGADDYLTKPFSPRELVARVKAILRRTALSALENNDAGERRKPLLIGDLQIDIEGYESYFQGKLLQLTPKEFELLVYMATNRGRVLSRDHLLDAVWNYDFVGDSRIVDVHVSHLRDKIEHDTRQPLYIKTIRGVGYKFEGPKDA